MKLLFSFAVVSRIALCWQAESTERTKIILVYSDDISARELSLYGSLVWSKPTRGDTTDEMFRAKNPALDQMAAEGCWVTTA